MKKVTNVFSKKILAKRALREIKLLQHFRGEEILICLFNSSRGLAFPILTWNIICRAS